MLLFTMKIAALRTNAVANRPRTRESACRHGNKTQRIARLG